MSSSHMWLPCSHHVLAVPEKGSTMREKATVDGIEEALRQCGVTATTLTATEKEALDRQGYLVFPEVIDQAWLGRLRSAFDAALAEGRRRGVGCELDWKDPVFDGLCIHPKVLAAVYHVLGRS